jgi:hypothetical protein
VDLRDGEGGVAVPVVYGSVVLGMLAVWRPPAPAEAPSEPGLAAAAGGGRAGQEMAGDGRGGGGWTGKERVQLDSIARTLALALALDQVGGCGLRGAGAWSGEERRGGGGEEEEERTETARGDGECVE